MAIVTRCPDCGKRARLPESDAGRTTICAACGFSFTVPGEIAAPPAAKAEPLLKVEALAPGVAKAVESVPPPRQRTHAGARWAIAAGVMFVVLGVGAGGYMLSRRLPAMLAHDQSQQAKADTEHPQSDHKVAAVAATEPGSALRGEVNSADLRPAETRVPAELLPPPLPNLEPPPAPVKPPVVAVPSTSPNEPAGVDFSRPRAHPLAAAQDELSDDSVGEAIQRGVNFLIREFDPKLFELRDGLGSRRGGGQGDSYHDGADVLCVYALMQCGEAINDPRLNMHGTFMNGCIETMKGYTLVDHFSTYSRGLRATALALYNRKEDTKILKADVAALLKTSNHGAYSYFDSAAVNAKNGVWDNSNAQYGLLGVWSGAEAEVEVPTSYWRDVEKHWTSCQAPSGAWAYTEGLRGDTGITMTCAGIASLFVCHDWLDAPKFGSSVGREPFSPPLQRGLAWLEKGNNSMQYRNGMLGYSVYGVERAGLASGFKYFGSHNWYPEIARDIINTQEHDGSWRNIVDTAYCLLFLSRGRHPILMNKLRFDGHWANRPRDVANLAKYASSQLEHPINWQVVPLSGEWTAWLDSPILYLASHIPPKLSESEVTRIRKYVEAGGMLFVQADGDAPAMGSFAGELAHRLFPKYEMANVPPSHPLFSSVYKIEKSPPLKMVSNGSRILMLFSPTDLSRRWQLREQRGQAGKPVYQLGLNMFVYAAGRRDMRNRLETNYIPPISEAPAMTVKMARLQYAGAWDPEPYAWTRFAKWFRRQTDYSLDVETIELRDLDASQFHFAHLTGTAPYKFTASEVAVVQKYVEAGGVLLIDQAGGGGLFDESVRNDLLVPAFHDPASGYISIRHPLLQPGPSGMEDLAHIRVRPYVLEKLGSDAVFPRIFKAGKGHVIFSRLDLTSGLLNTGTWGILGYEPRYAQSFVKNAIFWTLDGQKDK